MSGSATTRPSRVHLRLSIDGLDDRQRTELRDELAALGGVRAEFSPTDRTMGVGDIVLTVGGGAAATLIADAVRAVLARGFRGRLSRKDDPARSVELSTSSEPDDVAKHLTVDEEQPAT